VSVTKPGIAEQGHAGHAQPFDESAFAQRSFERRVGVFTGPQGATAQRGAEEIGRSCQRLGSGGAVRAKMAAGLNEVPAKR
jgi:hypothetical protein